MLLDFFVEASGRGADLAARESLVAVDVSFGDAVQVFHIGAASCGTYGTPAGVCAAADRFGTVPLPELTAPAVALAREGVRVNSEQAYVYEILAPIYSSTAECRALFMPEGRVPREGDVLRDPEMADSLERLGAEGAAPFYSGDIGAAISDCVCRLGGTLTREDLAAYEALPREPVRVRYHGREVLTNPPPSAGGTLLAYALALLQRSSGPPDAMALVEAMERAQAERTPEFLTGLGEPGFLDRFMASRLGSTTHISVIDGDGWACAVTCTNGEGSGVVVPGTGVHVNNMMGEQDLSPLGFFTHPPGQRLPSMMAPTVVLGRDGAPELALGSAGSNRIRSALLQVIVNVLDRGHGGGRGGRRAAAALRGRDRLRRARDRRGRAGGERPDDGLVPRPQPVLRRLPGGRARAGDRRAPRRGRSAPRRRRGRSLTAGSMRRCKWPITKVNASSL